MGILSMQRVLNYGSFLQAYALKQLLLQNGADDVYFIDIEKGRSLAGFEQENSLLKKLFRAIVLLVQGQLPAKIRDMKFMVKLAKSLKSQWPELSLDEINPNHFGCVCFYVRISHISTPVYTIQICQHPRIIAVGTMRLCRKNTHYS